MRRHRFHLGFSCAGSDRSGPFAAKSAICRTRICSKASAQLPCVAITKWVIATYGMRASAGAFSITVNADRSESGIARRQATGGTITPAQELIAAAHSDFNARLLSTEADLPSVEVRKEATDQANRLYAVLAVLKAGQQLDGRLLSPDVFTIPSGILMTVGTLIPCSSSSGSRSSM